MDVLKIKASSLVETLIALVILSISLSAIGLIFSHFIALSSKEKEFSSKVELITLEKRIQGDKNFVDSYKDYESEYLKVKLVPFNDKDSISVVELISTDSTGNFIGEHKFVYVKN